MAGLVPAIHGFSGRVKGVDTRDKPGQDGSVFPQLGSYSQPFRLNHQSGRIALATIAHSATG